MAGAATLHGHGGSWGEVLDAQKSALRWDIKRTMKSLCQKLTEIGEECFVVTVNVSNGWVGHMGSIRGEEYMEDRDQIPWDFLQFCRGCNQMGETVNDSDSGSEGEALGEMTGGTDLSEQESSGRIRLETNIDTDADTAANHDTGKKVITGCNQMGETVNDTDDTDSGSEGEALGEMTGGTDLSEQESSGRIRLETNIDTDVDTAANHDTGKKVITETGDRKMLEAALVTNNSTQDFPCVTGDNKRSKHSSKRSPLNLHRILQRAAYQVSRTRGKKEYLNFCFQNNMCNTCHTVYKHTKLYLQHLKSDEHQQKVLSMKNMSSAQQPTQPDRDATEHASADLLAVENL